MKTLKKNLFFLTFFSILLLVGLILFLKSTFSESHRVYIKLKVGQGYWWAGSQRPSTWYLNAISKGDTARNILGSPIAKIVEKRHYRLYGGDQFDLYLTVLLDAGFNKKTGQYTFDRSILSVSSPIQIQFQRELVTGTVIAISKNQFNDILEEKTISLTKKYAYPWEYDSIPIGASYFDGEETILKVISKEKIPSSDLPSIYNGYTNNGASLTEQTNYISVKIKAKLKKSEGTWLLGEDQIVSPGRGISISPLNYVLDNYIVTKIE